MDELLTKLIAFAGGLAVAAVGALIAMRQRKRWQAAIDAPDDERCVACRSSLLQTVAPSVYRCGACGYEGGAGLAELILTRRIEAAKALDPEARERLIREELTKTRDLITAAVEALRAVRGLVQVDRSLGKRADLQEAQQRIASEATRDLMVAARSIELVDALSGSHARRLELESPHLALDIRIDHLFSGREPEARVVGLIEHGTQMLASLDERLHHSA